MRIKLWNLVDFQCSVVGTCLTMGELRSVAKRFRHLFEDTHSDFALHAQAVALCKQDCPFARAVSKKLDRKFATTLRRVAKLRTDDDLLALWEEHCSAGTISGPYWALVTHPHISDDARNYLFGEVHMLSHIVGSATRADIRRIRQLEERLDKARQRHEWVRSAYRERLQRLNHELRSVRKRLGEVALEAESLRAVRSAGDPTLLARENEDLRRIVATQAMALQQLHLRQDDLQARLAERETALQQTRTQEQAASQTLQALLATRPANDVCNECPTPTNGPDCPGRILCGKRLLYVGGRRNLVPRYREAVERLGGEFVHHDGGCEQSPHELSGLIGEAGAGADVVVCPVDCVSHDACLLVKKLCKLTGKRCLFIRSAGLSSLERSLGELPAQHAEQ